METIYITGNGLQLKRRSRRIILKKSGKVVGEHPIHRLKRVVIFGNNQATTDLLSHLAKQGIDVAYLTTRGRLKFRIVSTHSKNIYLRLAQYQKFRDEEFCLSLARSLVKSKVKNQRTLMRRYKPYHGQELLAKGITQLNLYAKKPDTSSSFETLRGIEGNASKVYFDMFSLLVKKGFSFSGRKYHPSPDPVNALLSFGYTLVTNELAGLLEAHGFDPLLGFYHKIQYGRVSLAVDLVEQFRAPIIDRLVLYLINKRVIKPEDFENDKEHGVRMSNRAIKAYLGNYDQFVTSSFRDKLSSIRTNYRSIFKQQVLRLEKCLLNNEVFVPYFFY